MPLIIASILPPKGTTGVNTHIAQLQGYLANNSVAATLVTPYSWARPLTVPVFGFRFAVTRLSNSAGVLWYRYWHEIFLRNALRRRLGELGECVIYAQGPEAARAALTARRGPHQRVVMAVHFSVSHADTWVAARGIKQDGIAFQAIRRDEKQIIPKVDVIVYVSKWARSALLAWLPEAADVPSAVVRNFVSPAQAQARPKLLGDLVNVSGLGPIKNHAFLLEVMAAASRSGRRLTLDVYGEGRSRDELMRRARSLGLEQQVRWRGFKWNVRDYLPGYRAYVHSALCESALPLAIAEAMAAGLPVVAGNVGGISEVRDGSGAIRFWPLDDPSGAAAILLDLLDHEPARMKASMAASEKFNREFDARVIGPQLHSFLLGESSQSDSAEVLAEARALESGNSSLLTT